MKKLSILLTVLLISGIVNAQFDRKAEADIVIANRFLQIPMAADTLPPDMRPNYVFTPGDIMLKTSDNTVWIRNAAGTAWIPVTNSIKALPLTGGTLTGQLNGTSANFTGVLNGTTATFTGSINGAYLTLGNGNLALGTATQNAGHSNTSIGTGTLAFNSADGNTGVGSGVFHMLSGGSNGYSTALGYHAGYNYLGGLYNTAIGVFSNLDASAFADGDFLQNSTAIGAYAHVTTSNTIQLGDSNVTKVSTFGNINTSANVTSGGDILAYNNITSYNNITASGSITSSGTLNANGTLNAHGNIIASGNIVSSGNVSAVSFVKTGGTANQALMADGSTTVSNVANLHAAQLATAGVTHVWACNDALGSSSIADSKGSVVMSLGTSVLGNAGLLNNGLTGVQILPSGLGMSVPVGTIPVSGDYTLEMIVSSFNYTGLGCIFALGNNSNRCTMYMQSGVLSVSNPTQDLVSNVNFPSSTVLLNVVVTGGACSVYMNGQNVFNVSGMATSTTGEAQFGRYLDNTSYAATLRIQDIAVYNVALTPAQINAHLIAARK